MKKHEIYKYQSSFPVLTVRASSQIIQSEKKKNQMSPLSHLFAQ